MASRPPCPASVNPIKWVPAIVERQRIALAHPPTNPEEVYSWEIRHRAERLAMIVEWLYNRSNGELLKDMETLFTDFYGLAPCECGKHYVERAKP